MLFLIIIVVAVALGIVLARAFVALIPLLLVLFVIGTMVQNGAPDAAIWTFLGVLALGWACVRLGARRY